MHCIIETTSGISSALIPQRFSSAPDTIGQLPSPRLSKHSVFCRGASASTQLLLEICGGGREVRGGPGEALPIVWCPSRPSPDRQRGHRDGGEEEEQSGGLNRAVRLAWIPDDPCSCANAAGLVGEACRGWLRTRSFGPRLHFEVQYVRGCVNTFCGHRRTAGAPAPPSIAFALVAVLHRNVTRHRNAWYGRRHAWKFSVFVSRELRNVSSKRALSLFGGWAFR